jgi:flagellar basal body-associated protein FliL
MSLTILDVAPIGLFSAPLIYLLIILPIVAVLCVGLSVLIIFLRNKHQDAKDKAAMTVEKKDEDHH